MTEGLSAELKSAIQSGYSNWLAGRGFRARRGQREMIAAVARSFAGETPPRLLAVEAGTGTGKTAAYCLAAIPIARARNKTLVVSSATVALQEQVVLRDLPDLAAHAGLKFSFALAKGRGRYVCLKRLDDQLRQVEQQALALFERPGEDALALYQEMLAAFAERRWDGELDSWPEGVDGAAWRAITTDHRGCSNSRCGFFRQCPFFRARGELDGVDVIVANHDLLLADLSLGGGAVLPEPEDCLYVIDEAHHLPDKTQQHFSVSARLGGTRAWLETLTAAFGSLAQRCGRPTVLTELATRSSTEAAALQAALETLLAALGELDFASRDGRSLHRFAHGRVPALVTRGAAQALPAISALAELLRRAHDELAEALGGNRDWQNVHEAEDWLPVIGQLENRALALAALLEDYARAPAPADAHGEGTALASHARWCQRLEEDLELVSAPIEAGALLGEVLWSRCYGALCTSATLTALGRFDRFLAQVGLPELPTVRIASPFDYPKIATFAVPDMTSDPRDAQAHSDEIARRLPELLRGGEATLVLFTSWRQLNAVRGQLDDGPPLPAGAQLLVQGDLSKQALLGKHREAVDRGETSILFGLASFAEGIDLPGAYCRHVIIAKLPFAVPDDPLDQALAERVEAAGGNAFFDVAVPDAALRLVQACGRLIRSEDDWGRITLLDRRILTQRYGRALLDSLPPFRRELAGSENA